MPKKGIFKTDFTEPSGPTDPEALFRDIRGRAPEIKHLWSHQADLLRAYHQRYLKLHDVAIELPTGAGKTLVGLLIAEWRRLALGARVAYVCPTRQLARQVGEQAVDYGIHAHVLIGKQRDYSPQEFGAYQSSRAIAITTYSAIFNINPKLKDAQTLILDDAHAGENFAANMWSVEISRSNYPDLYHAIVRLLKDELEAAFYSDIAGEEWEPSKSGLIELVPGSAYRRHTSAIRDLLDEQIKIETPEWYAWGLVKGHLGACNLFISWESILIRPFIPPTQTHAPFSQANQRIYMSATLGAGGELERITGIKSIERLPLPSGWDKRGSGRRLFLIPELALSEVDAVAVARVAIEGFKRSLILVPGQQDREAANLVHILPSLGLKVLRANDIEDSLEPFVGSENCVLVLSRYDGLDLPDEACRLLVIAGLPSGTNLQEKFLWSRIAASSLLRDRVLTRFTQGVGRCTRSDNDYAVVLIIGHRLVEFVLKHENRRILNPELQAEIGFGIENSRDKGSEDFVELMQAFMEQGEEWKVAETAIVSLRERAAKHHDPISKQLSSIVGDEVSYLYALWRDDLETALEHARKVADALGGEETKAYRAWWYYLAANTAMALSEDTGDRSLRDTSRDLLKRASGCCIGVSWFARLGRSIYIKPTPSELDNEVTAIATERIRENLTKWGAVGKRFEQQIGQIGKDLQSTDHKFFHKGLKGLGEMLGFQAELPSSDGAPDCIWSIGNSIYVVHEAKSEQAPEAAIGINDVRQAQSHENWVLSNRSRDKGTKILCLVETPRTTVALEALPHAKSLFHVHTKELKEIFDMISAILRRVRSKLTDLSDEKILEDLFNEIDSAKLKPGDLFELLRRHPVDKMATQDGK